MHGAMFTPVILGADKTTVSVMTGHQQYHPLYMSLGNIHNEMCRAHCDAVIPIAFLAIPKREYSCLPLIFSVHSRCVLTHMSSQTSAGHGRVSSVR